MRVMVAPTRRRAPCAHPSGVDRRAVAWGVGAAGSGGTFRAMERHVEPLGTYSLAASTGFLEGFVPAGYTRPAAAGHLHLAYPVDVGAGDAVAAVCARQPDDPAGSVLLDAVADDDPTAAAALDQLTRILSLDTDGRGYE